jgi:hypothetical protein
LRPSIHDSFFAIGFKERLLHVLPHRFADAVKHIGQNGQSGLRITPQNSQLVTQLDPANS